MFKRGGSMPRLFAFKRAGPGIRSLVLLMTALSFLVLSCKPPDEKTAVVDFSERIQAGVGAEHNGGASLRIALAAVVSPRETAVYYDEMMEYVGDKIGMPVEVVQRKTYREINDMLERREIDAAFVCSGPYVEGHRKFGMELLVAPMLYGKPFYQAYIIVHRKNAIFGLEGLRGKSFAFTDPDSNTGHLVPTYMLARMGETPESFFKRFIFTYSHDNSIKAVSKGLVDGASVDGLIWEYFRDRKPEFVKDTKVILKSPEYGIPPVVVHPAAPPELKERLRDTFLSMHEDPRGREILAELRIERFIVPEDSSYDSVRRMQEWVEAAK